MAHSKKQKGRCQHAQYYRPYTEEELTNHKSKQKKKARPISDNPKSKNKGDKVLKTIMMSKTYKIKATSTLK